MNRTVVEVTFGYVNTSDFDWRAFGILAEVGKEITLDNYVSNAGNPGRIDASKAKDIRVLDMTEARYLIFRQNLLAASGKYRSHGVRPDHCWLPSLLAKIDYVDAPYAKRQWK